MKRTVLLLLSGLCLISGQTFAQSLPFDMSSERPAGSDISKPESDALPKTQDLKTDNKQAPALDSAVNAAAEETIKPTQHTKSKEQRRYFLTTPEAKLSGEVDQATWTMFLSSQQAAHPRALKISYSNTIVVAPENSVMTVLINDKAVLKEALSSSGNAKSVEVPMPKDLLHYGNNTITIQVDQRHRTDCDIPSTYELITQIQAASTYLTFDPTPENSDLEAIRTVGVDEKGATYFDVFAPSLKQFNMSKQLLSLSEGLALLGGMPNQHFTFSSEDVSTSAAGHLNVLVGTKEELEAALSGLLPSPITSGAKMQYLVGMQNPVLIISGENHEALASEIETIMTPLRSISTTAERTSETTGWVGPNIPTIVSETSMTLANLGVKTQEFSGRRFKTDFSVILPGDFYGSASSEFTLLLDAAYAPQVLPGNKITVFVNDQVASVVPINNRHGGIFRHYAVSVTMRHFKPGLNKISLVAELATQEDQVCAPEQIGSTDSRFALFNTSEIKFSNFARAKQYPDLASTTRSGYPFANSTQPLKVLLDPLDRNTLASASTLLGKLSLVSGKAIELEPTTSLRSIGENDALFVIPAFHLPRQLITQFHLDADATAAWGKKAAVNKDEDDTNKQFNDWNERISSSGVLGIFESFDTWLEKNYGFSVRSLDPTQRRQKDFLPTTDQDILLAQSLSFDESGKWMLLTGPTAERMDQGSAFIADQARWDNAGGYAVAFSKDKMTSGEIVNPRLTLDDPWNVRNLRLVATDWLSRNSVFYVALLVLAAIILAVTWAGLLKHTGRRE